MSDTQPWLSSRLAKPLAPFTASRAQLAFWYCKPRFNTGVAEAADAYLRFVEEDSDVSRWGCAPRDLYCVAAASDCRNEASLQIRFVETRGKRGIKQTLLSTGRAATQTEAALRGEAAGGRVRSESTPT